MLGHQLLQDIFLQVLNLVNLAAALASMLGHPFLQDIFLQGIGKKKSKLHPSYNNLAGECKLVQQLVKCSI